MSQTKTSLSSPENTLSIDDLEAGSGGGNISRNNGAIRDYFQQSRYSTNWVYSVAFKN